MGNGLTLVKRTGGVDTSDANAGPYQILTGYSGYVDDERIEGTMPNRGTHSYTLPVNSSHTIPDGWHNGSGKITQNLATQGGATVTPGTSSKLVCAANKWVTGNLWVAGDADLVAGNIKKGVTLFGVTGTYAGCVTSDATVTADKVLTGYSIYGSAGTKIAGTMPNRGAVSQSLSVNGSYTIPNGWHNGNGKVTQSLSTQAGATVTPGTSSKLVCAANKWVTGNLWVAGDADLVAGNIKKGVTLFGVTGTYAGCVTSDATVLTGYVLSGYTIYNKSGTKITGDMINNGAVSHSLAANGSYTIPWGWHNGSGKVTQSLTTQEGKTVTPTTRNILLCSKDRWVTGDIIVLGDYGLKAENIKKGVTIFGITGTYEPGINLNDPGIAGNYVRVNPETEWYSGNYGYISIGPVPGNEAIYDRDANYRPAQPWLKAAMQILGNRPEAPKISLLGFNYQKHYRSYQGGDGIESPVLHVSLIVRLPWSYITTYKSMEVDWSMQITPQGYMRNYSYGYDDDEDIWWMYNPCSYISLYQRQYISNTDNYKLAFKFVKNLVSRCGVTKWTHSGVQTYQGTSVITNLDEVFPKKLTSCPVNYNGWRANTNNIRYPGYCDWTQTFPKATTDGKDYFCFMLEVGTAGVNPTSVSSRVYDSDDPRGTVPVINTEHWNPDYVLSQFTPHDSLAKNRTDEPVRNPVLAEIKAIRFKK